MNYDPNDPMKSLINYYVQMKKPVLLRFRDDPAPAGPGLITEIEVSPRASGVEPSPALFVFAMPIQAEGRRGILPITFRPEDVLWVSTGAVEAKEESPIIMPPSGPISFGGGGRA